MTTLFDVLLGTARRVRSFKTGTATGGTTTTLIDTVYRVEEDDYFNGQTLFMLSGDNANISRSITDFANSTATLTISPALDDAPVAGDRYLISQAIREDLVQAIAIALDEIGNVTNIDDSLVIVADQTEYTLPAGVSGISRVEIAGMTTGDYDYRIVHNWDEINGQIVFDNGLPFSPGNTIRLYYNARHATVDADTDVVSDSLPIPLITAIAAFWYTRNAYGNRLNADIKENPILTMALEERSIAKRMYRVNRIPRDPKFGGG